MASGDLWQAYSEDGQQIVGQPITRSQAALGALHGAAHVWIWRTRNGQIEILLQKRSANKLTWPGHLDISAAGHIDFGETPEVAACREVKEELGYDVSADQLRLLFTKRQFLVSPPKDTIENEIRWIYGLYLEAEISFKHDDEVEDTIWLTLHRFRDLIAAKTPEKIVPHGDDYFRKLIKAIKS